MWLKVLQQQRVIFIHFLLLSFHLLTHENNNLDRAAVCLKRTGSFFPNKLMMVNLSIKNREKTFEWWHDSFRDIRYNFERSELFKIKGILRHLIVVF